MASSTRSSGRGSRRKRGSPRSGRPRSTGRRSEESPPASSDFVDLLSEFAAADVRYLLVGGHAVAFHAEPRFTKDLDLWIEASIENAERVYLALRRFGAPLRGISAADFATPGTVLQLGVAPNRVDILTEISGVAFGPAWSHRVRTRLGSVETWVISLEDLSRNKAASARPQDLRDLTALRLAARRGR